MYIDRHIAARHMQAMFRKLPSAPASMKSSLQHLAADGLGGTCKALLGSSSAQAAGLKGKWLHENKMYALEKADLPPMAPSHQAIAVSGCQGVDPWSFWFPHTGALPVGGIAAVASLMMNTCWCKAGHWALE